MAAVEVQSPLLENSHSSSKGGFTTLPFIFGNLAFTSLVSSAVEADRIMYLMREYNMDMASGSNLIYFLSALSNVAPIIGAFMADSFVGRFQTIGVGSLLGFLGMALLWLTTVIPQARPSHCNKEMKDTICESSTTLQMIFLCTSFVLMSVGCGWTKISLAFGADQLKNLKSKTKDNVGIMEGYFSWYYAVQPLCVIVAMTGLVYIQENKGWVLGFGILVVFSFLAALIFFFGSPFYFKPKAKKSLISGLIQVIVASYRNRHLNISSGLNDNISYHSPHNTMAVLPSQKLRFLNKACIVQDPERDITSDGRAVNPWRLCTVEQVEELKALIKVIPIWLTGAIVSINVSQTSFAVLQAEAMDRHIGKNFEIPAGSVTIFAIVSVVVWIALYDRVIIPIASRIRGKAVHFGTKLRMGFGLLVSLLAMVTVAVVEGIRRSAAADNDDEMSILWVAPQFALMGFAGAINGIAQNEFYISEFPESMSGIASNLSQLGVAFGSVLASLVMTVVNKLTTKGGHDSWISNDINKGHYDYFHWVLAGLSIFNLLLFFREKGQRGP